ncbi:MAG: CBS domain-containing protein [Pseudomonadales bacterium]|nr:CBS domain-containing protein [Pseudomonadales bacterium]MCP5329603.1 CBS domain-containing protein [Pseudomonadales bacterium]MCP5343858.1 CBS domain-containing protein [Pseudomonadales bacterium]
MTLDEIMSHPVATVEMDDSLKDVKVLLDNAPFHHVLVVESGVLWGVISDRDVYRELSPTLGTPMESTRDLALLNKPVHTFMTRKPITLPKTATLFEAVTLFNHHDISCIPIVDAEKHVLGIVTTHDLLKLLEARRYRLSESMAATDKGN